MNKNIELFDILIALMEELEPSHVLEVNLGQDYISSFINKTDHDIIIDGYLGEICINRNYFLNSTYNHVYNVSSKDITSLFLESVYDAVLIDSSICVWKKSFGIDFLNLALAHSAYVIIFLDTQSDHRLQDYVSRQPIRSIWSERDLIWHDNWALALGDQMKFGLLRGLAPASVDLAQLIEGLERRQLGGPAPWAFQFRRMVGER